MLKRLNTTSILIILFIVVLIALGVKIIQKDISSKSDDTLKQEKLVSLVNVENFKKEDFGISAIGQVESLKQVDLKAQTSGEIKRVNVKIGDEVRKGDLLAEIDHSVLDGQLAQSSAMIDRMKSGLDLRVAGATKEQITQAQKAIEQAEAGLAQAEASLAQVKSGNTSLINNAEIALNMTESNLTNTGASSNLATENANENLKIAMDSGLSTIYGALTAMGNIWGVSPGEPTSDDLFKDVLGAKDVNQKNKAKSDFDKAKRNYETFNNKEITSLNVSELSIEAVHLLDLTKTALDSSRKTLDNTITNYIFSNSALNGLKSGIDLQISYVNSTRSALNGARQGVEGSYLADTSASDVNELTFIQAQQNLSQAKEQVKANLESAEAVVALQKAGLAQAEAAYNFLVADPREVDLGALKASVKEAQASYSILSINRDKAFIRAPFSGKVSSVPVRLHDLINPGQNIVSIVNSGGLQIKAFVNEKERMNISTGSEVLIEEKYKGVVINIAPSIDPMTKKIEVLIAVNDNDEGLTIGQYVEVKIAINKNEDNVYYLSLKSIRNTSQTSFIFIVDEEDKIKEQEVKLGEIIDEKVEVLEGLNEGMEIIESVRGLKEGEQVKF